MTAPTETVELPKLPEPEAGVWDHDKCSWTTFTADQMSEFARAAVLADRASRSPVVGAVGGEPTDTQRLDWLDATNTRFRMGWKVGMAPAGNVSVQSVIQLGTGPLTTIREAIDAAKEAAK